MHGGVPCLDRRNMARSTEDREVSVDQATAVRKIRFLIDTHHETVPGLAKGIGVLPGTIQDVLDGQSLVSSALVRRIADRFKLPMDFFSAEPVSEKEAPAEVATVKSTRARRVESKVETQTSSAADNETELEEILRTQKALVELLIDKGVIHSGEWQARLRRTRLSR